MKDVGRCVSGKCPGDGRDPERTDTPEHRAVESFIRVHKAHRAYLERKLNGTGVYRSQHQILMCIARNPDISQKSLAEIYHVSTAAVTVTLKKLEKGGFITRTVNKNDNRCNEIGLTEKGRAVVEESRAFFRQTECGMFYGFSPEELERFCGYLDRIRTNLETMEREPEACFGAGERNKNAEAHSGAVIPENAGEQNQKELDGKNETV